MNYNHSLAYLLLYAARIDTRVTPNEALMIIKQMGNVVDYEKLSAEFEQDDEYTRLQKAEEILDAHPTPESRIQLMEEIRNLFNADGNFSETEEYILHLIGKL